MEKYSGPPDAGAAAPTALGTVLSSPPYQGLLHMQRRQFQHALYACHHGCILVVLRIHSGLHHFQLSIYGFLVRCGACVRVTLFSSLYTVVTSTPAWVFTISIFT